MNRKLLSLALTLALVLGLAAPAWAAEPDENGFTIENGVLTTYSGEGGEITIPDSATSIGRNAFYSNSKITSVTIPSTVTEVGPYAFSQCSNLASVTFSDTPTVSKFGEYAFAFTAITTFSIPASITDIADDVFRGCEKMTSVSIAEGATAFEVSSDGRTLTQGLDSKRLVCYISDGTSTYTIPDGVTEIASGAFYVGSQEPLAIHIPSSVATIGIDPFFNATGFTVDNANTAFCAEDGVLYDKDKTTLCHYPCSTSATSFQVPSTVKTIGTWAFLNAHNLTSVELPDGLEQISDTGFGFTGLTEITIPASVTKIDSFAFIQCTALKKVTVLGKDTAIGNWTSGTYNLNPFQGCTGLTVYGLANSTIKSYCEANSIPFVVYSDYEGTDAMVSVTQADGVYGTELSDAVTAAQHTSTNGAWTVKYTGRDGTAYPESADKPTLPGQYTVTASYADDKYTGSATADFEITKKPVTVTADNKSMSYGGALPELTFTAPSLVGRDTAADLGVTLTAAGAKPAVGTYDITGSASSAKYDVTVTPGTLTVGKAAAPVVAPLTRSYLATEAYAGETVDVAALLPADRGESTFAVGTVNDVNSILDGNPSLVDGVLTFSVKAGTAGQTAAIPVNVTGMTNYEDATVTVNVALVDKNVVTITGVSITGKTYDGRAVTPAGTPAAEGYHGSFEYLYTGTGETTYSSAEAPKNAGTYTLTVKVPDSDPVTMGATDPMPFTIEKAALTVKPADKSIYVGDALPTEFELTYTGFVNGETVADLTVTGAPEFALKNGENALENSNSAGTYAIQWTNKGAVTIEGANYAVTKADGALTISTKSSGGGGGSSSGDSSSGGISSKPTTNPDGSTTTTTKNPDGSTTAVTESKDGGKTTETTTKSGTTITATTPADNSAASTVSTTVKAEVKDGAVKAEVPAKDVDALVNAVKDSKAEVITITPAVKEGTEATAATVSLPAEAVTKLAQAADVAVATPVGTVTLPAAALAELGSGKETVSVTLEVKTDAEAPTFNFELKTGDRAVEAVPGGVKVALPAEQPTPGTVAVLVLADGTEQIIRKSAAGADGVAALLDGSATVKLVDNAKTFPDVPAENWAADAVAFATGHDLFQGVNGDSFAPDMTMNRGMLVTVLNRLENEAKGETAADFTDVAEGAYYANAVAWATANGIVTGTGAGFNPDGEITRESLAVMLYRYADTLDYDTAATAATVGEGVSDWAADAMAWAVGSGLLQGDGNGDLRPAASATRAETAAILQRFVEGMVE